MLTFILYWVYVNNLNYLQNNGHGCWSSLRSQPDLYVGQESDCKRFIEAIIWMSRSGAPWRLLPSEYGKWNSVYKRFARWCEGGIWERMHQHFIDDPDMEYLIIDSTVVRAHHSAAGAPKKTVVKYLTHIPHINPAGLTAISNRTTRCSRIAEHSGYHEC